MKKEDESSHSNQDQEKNKSKLISSIEGLPEDLIRDILSRLSVNSLLRCKAVNKQWKSLIEDKYFVSVLHFDRANRHILQFDNNDYYVLDSFCGLVWKMGKKDPFKHIIHNPSTGQILHLPAASHPTLQSPKPKKGSTTAPCGLIAFNRSTHECKLQLRCQLVNDPSREIQTFEVGKDINWRSIERGRAGHSHVPDDAMWRLVNLPANVLRTMLSESRQFTVRNSGVLHRTRVYMVEGNVLLVVSDDIWDDMRVGTCNVPRGISFDFLKAHFIEWDDCLAIAEIIGEELHLLKMKRYDDGDWRWSEHKMIVPLTFLSAEPYSEEGDQVAPLLFRSTVLWFQFRGGRPLSYDVQARRINEFELPLPKREGPVVNNELEYFPSLVRLEGMRAQEGNEQW